MEDRQMEPQLIVDPPPQTQTYAEPHAHRQKQPAGPQIWAVVLTLGGLYYLWTRILGKSLPSFAQKGHRIGANKGRSSGIIGGSSSSSNRQAEIQAARERQQQRLQTATLAHDMVKQATKNNDRNTTTVRERTNATSSGNTNSTNLSIQQQQQLLQHQQLLKQKQQELEEKKKKQRQLYLKQKALKEKEEEIRKKDEEMGPGWRYREDPDAANAVNSMDPQSGGSGGGGYKPQACSKRGGG